MDPLQIINFIFGNLGILCVVIAIISMPINLILVRRQFDPLFGEIGGVKGEVGIPIWSPCVRSTTYAWCIAFKNQSKNKPYLYKLYQGYDFRANTTVTMRLISRVYIYSMLCALMFSLIGYIANQMISAPLN